MKCYFVDGYLYCGEHLGQGCDGCKECEKEDLDAEANSNYIKEAM